MKKTIRVWYISYDGENACESFNGITHAVFMLGDRENMLAIANADGDVVLGIPVQRVILVRTTKEE